MRSLCAARTAQPTREVTPADAAAPASHQIKSNLALRSVQTELTTGSATVNLSPRHEVEDVITLTDTRTGYSATATRIMALTAAIEFHTGMWEQRLELNSR